MVITAHNVVLIISLLLFIAIFAGQASYKFGVPALIIFLGVGMLAGSEGIGKIQFGYEHANIAQFIGVIALNFILFSGGLDTKWRSIKPVLGKGMVLATLGVVLTAVFVGIAVKLITGIGGGPGFSWAESLLLGSIVSSTDAAAVFNILNTKSLSLKYNLKPLLEFESGSNDPMAFLLTTFFLSMVDAQSATHSVGGAILMLFVQMAVGVLMGFVMGKVSTKMINKLKIGYEGLYPVLAIALMLFTYSFTDFLHGNGFLAVYICGIFVGNHKISHRQTIVNSFDGYAWLMQLVLFLTLGLLVFPSQVWEVKWTGLLISAVIIILARPLAIFLCSLFFKDRFNFRNQIFISWVGLRGAAAIVFATYPLLAGIPNADMMFSLVFFIAFSSMVLQGSTIPWVAKRLKLAYELPPALLSRKDLDTKTELIEIMVRKGSSLDNQTLLEAQLPDDTRVTMIMRKGEYIVPSGNTRLQAKDHLYVICKNPDEVRRLVS
ncbi:MAG: potassium/proton antiporter [Bacteroidetes bacterium]|uniref:Potassium/proton antiporter n=1 Tax=Candidatus Pullibacteroides excrementavium TaxID=2840905 RepID=A0A9D9DU02_9BACT|nr:potassium/proton antiporter [Candidatus Pullibacteroides excrementavium]